MRKTLAILATVAAVGATAVTAPAEARGRGIGPGLCFRPGCRRTRRRRGGRLRLLRSGLWLLRLRPPLLPAGLLRLRIWALRLLRRPLLSAPLLAPWLVTKKPGSIASGFFFYSVAKK